MRNPLSATALGLFHRLRREQRLKPLGADVRLDGLRCLITGASSGLGLAAATELAERGADLVLACRSGIPELGDRLHRQTGAAVEMQRVDLADLDSVRDLADRLAAAKTPLDVVVVNAAVMPRRSRRTHQGFEEMFAVNYLAHALLLGRLLRDGVVPNEPFAGAPRAGRRPRIVVVSSEVHRHAAPIDFAALGRYVDYGPLDGMAQYAHTKLLLCTLAQELARRLAPAGRVDVAVHSLCPGAVHTGIAREAPRWLKPLLDPIMRWTFAPPERAVAPVLYLAATPALEGQTGRYLHTMVDKPPSAAARDRDNGRALWDATVRLLAEACGQPGRQ